MASLLSLHGVLYAFAAFVTYVAVKTIYRLYFHPLAKFPGPKLAAAITLYNAYYDICTPGLIHKLPALHKKYGPLIRTQPNELHIASLEGYNQIFRVGTPFDRIWHDNPFLTGSLQSKETLAETKKRKEFLGPFFSKATITRTEPFLHRKKLALFLETLEKANGTVVDFFLAFRCLTADLIMDYCFQADVNALSKPGFRSKTVEAMSEGFDMALLPTFFPNFFGLVNRIIFALPASLREKHFKPVYGWQTMQQLSKERIEFLIAHPDKRDDKIPTMFDAMLNPDEKKGKVTPPMRDMVADGCLMIAAGTDTTANALGYILWGVTQNPAVEARLAEELKKAISEREELVESARLEGEGFEYMRAVVKEGLRLAYGVPGRILRKTPKEGAWFGDQFVPGGTVVTSGQYLQNADPVTFPSPLVFDPERWLCDAETYKARDRQMLTFSRGSRSCIGINLAYATLHLTVAHLFRRFKIITAGYTTQDDMEWSDKFVVSTHGRIKGLVKVRD